MEEEEEINVHQEVLAVENCKVERKYVYASPHREPEEKS